MTDRGPSRLSESTSKVLRRRRWSTGSTSTEPAIGAKGGSRPSIGCAHGLIAVPVAKPSPPSRNVRRGTDTQTTFPSADRQGMMISPSSDGAAIAEERSTFRLELATSAPDLTIRDLEPLDGARAARDIELGARHAARGYIRQAREAGHSWEQIGQALGVAPNADADQAPLTVAPAAYT